LAIEAVDVVHHWDPITHRAWLKVQVSCEGRTGIEMEALAGVTVGLLVLYDMLKAVSHHMSLGPARLLRKEGGKRGLITLPWPDCPWTP
jgi:cyclic pyranopterin phosphate synthase